MDRLDPLAIVILATALALIFNYLNGVNDSGSLVATMISSGALPPRRALLLTAVFDFLGPFVFGVAVAQTIATRIVDPARIDPRTIVISLAVAIAWNILAGRLGAPTSSTHALVGGLVGAAVVLGGLEALHVSGLLTVVVALLVSPVVGLCLGFIVLRVTLFLFRGATPRANGLFKRLQIPTSIFLALSHGSNDAQKSMGMITLTLVTLHVQSSFAVPLWAIVACSGALALGIATGGYRIIRTLGVKMYRIRPIHGFSAQATSASAILAAALIGLPVSTTHVVSSAILGVGSAERLSKVRWEVAGQIVVAWVVTIPVTALVAAGLAMVVRLAG